MNTQKIKAGDENMKNAIMDIESIADIDISPTEVDVPKIIVKGVTEKKPK